MKSVQLLIIALLLFTFTNAQEIKFPLEAKVKKESAPELLVENHTWVKSHYKWDAGKYVWVDGYFLEEKEGFEWVDGSWERNVKTGWWKFNDGYWRKKGDGVEFKSKPELMAENTSIKFKEVNVEEKELELKDQPSADDMLQVNIESAQSEEKKIVIKTSK
jgi:hypothetical protein